MAFRGNINDVIPPDLMREIFFHCLPWDPLKYEQPDVTIAPMLLCHVCSLWREIAFENPLLWTQLYHVAYPRSEVTNFDNRDISFLRWWRKRVQDVPPLLRLAFKEVDDEETDSEDEHGDEDKSEKVERDGFVPFLVEFMSSAQYLSLDSHFNDFLQRAYGERPLSCPNLHTLVMRRAPASAGNLDTEKLIPVNPKQSMRRLAIEDLFLSVEDVAPVLNLSNITHLDLVIRVTFPCWFSILRESVNLEYGSFSVTFPDEADDHIPKRIVLPHLQQMTFENFGAELRRSFLDGLHLPSLTALRIDHHIPLSVERLHRILASTPALRILQLGPTWTADDDLVQSVFIPGDLSPPPTPLSSVVPQLESIHFEGTTSMVDIFSADNRELVVSALNGDWLQLGRPTSRISCVYLGSYWDDGSVEWNEVVDLVEDLQKDMPAGVELAVRPYNAPRLWLSHWKHGDFTDEFEDLRFEF